MLRSVILIVFCLVMFGACKSDKEKALTESVMHAKTDSIVGSKMQELNKQSMDDLDERTAIEVKAKADSIVAAKTGKRETIKKQVSHVNISPQATVIPKKH